LLTLTHFRFLAQLLAEKMGFCMKPLAHWVKAKKFLLPPSCPKISGQDEMI